MQLKDISSKKVLKHSKTVTIIDPPNISKWDDNTVGNGFDFIKEEDQENDDDEDKMEELDLLSPSKKIVSFNNKIKVLEINPKMQSIPENDSFSPRLNVQKSNFTSLLNTPLKTQLKVLRDMKEMTDDAKKAKLIPLIPFNGESKKLCSLL